jgi:catechol 2,3-dioxygenase-like lactoylglutathione lyase family enzyme
MAIKGIFYITAHVADLARSKRFYGEVLGWTLQTDEPGVAGFAFGNSYLIALERSGGAPRAAAAPGGIEVEVLVDDVDAEHARLEARGVAVGDVCDRPWGERNFSFSDPDGHVWSYGQSTVEAGG